MNNLAAITENLYNREPRELVTQLLLMFKALQVVRVEGDYDDEDEWMQASAAHQRALHSFNELVGGPDNTNSGE